MLFISLDLGKKFAEQVAELAEKYFHPDRIQTKSIGFFSDVTAKELLHYMEKCANGVLNGDLPRFPTIMQVRMSNSLFLFYKIT